MDITAAADNLENFRKPMYLRDAGLQCLRAHRTAEAVALFRAALRDDFLNPELHRLLGHALELSNSNDAAADCYWRAISFGAPSDRVIFDIARSQLNNGDAALCLETLGAAPDGPHVRSQRALARYEMGECEVALRMARAAADAAPSATQLIGNLGTLLLREHRLEEALHCFERILAVSPEHVLARYHRSIVHLTRGDYSHGWMDIEAHLRLWGTPFERFGDVTSAKTVLLYCQNGLGDTLQFIRYAPWLIDRGTKVSVISQPRLFPLLQCALPQCEILSPHDSLQPHEASCSVIELPAAFFAEAGLLSDRCPYLTASSRLVDEWRARLADDTRPLNVGLAWHGAKERKNALYRSCRLQDLLPLGDVSNVRFHSLQVGAGSEELAEFRSALDIVEYHDFDRTEGCFMDTAALITNLDLVITVDTSIAHLAGALGRPTWILLPFWSDWRWMLDTDSTPWYPTARLFRQPKPFDWASLAISVRDALTKFVRGCT